MPLMSTFLLRKLYWLSDTELCFLMKLSNPQFFQYFIELAE